jgi:uncharacterized membrane protein YhaH (DUF805 family)
MHWYLDVLKKYWVFTGRARRTQYWMFVLFDITIAIALAVIDAIIGSRVIAVYFYTIVMVAPRAGVMVRRLHDTNRSAWWLLISLIPFGQIVLLVFLVLDGTPGSNDYGPDPKAATASTGHSETAIRDNKTATHQADPVA